MLSSGKIFEVLGLVGLFGVSCVALKRFSPLKKEKGSPLFIILHVKVETSLK